MKRRTPSRFGRLFRWRNVEPIPGALEAAAPPSPGGTLDATFRALRNRNYRLFYTGQAISLSGTWMQTIAQAILVIELTDSKIALGTVTMLQFLPITIFVLFAGVIADRVPKRNFIFATRTLAMAQALVLAALVYSGRVELWHVYSLAFVLGLSNAFEQPARQAFIVDMVGKDDLMNAIALNSGLFNGARLVGPAFGGVIIDLFGVDTAFLINGLSFIPILLSLALMDTSQLHGTESRRSDRMNPIGELREGLSYAFRTPSVLLVVILVAIVGTFGYNFTVMLPLLSEYVLDRGPRGLGFMTAAVGLGALISALVLASRSRAAVSTLFIGGFAFTALLAGVAFSQWYLLTLALLLFLGVANTTFASTANTSLQLATPDHLRGRVMALYMLLFAGSTPIGGFLTGFLAETMGVSTAIAVNAAACLLGVLIALAYYVSHRESIAPRELHTSPA
ncbi:MAG: MFS transporter [Dehalococcoidia bacterium]